MLVLKALHSLSTSFKEETCDIYGKCRYTYAKDSMLRLMIALSGFKKLKKLNSEQLANHDCTC